MQGERGPSNAWVIESTSWRGHCPAGRQFVFTGAVSFMGGGGRLECSTEQGTPVSLAAQVGKFQATAANGVAASLPVGGASRERAGIRACELRWLRDQPRSVRHCDPVGELEDFAVAGRTVCTHTAARSPLEDPSAGSSGPAAASATPRRGRRCSATRVKATRRPISPFNARRSLVAPSTEPRDRHQPPGHQPVPGRFALRRCWDGDVRKVGPPHPGGSGLDDRAAEPLAIASRAAGISSSRRPAPAGPLAC